MFRPCAVLFAPLIVLMASQRGSADFFFAANLTNSQETPTVTPPGSSNPPSVPVPTTTTGAPRPASFGTATFVLNDAMTAMTFTATIFNIDFTRSQTADTNDDLVNAHIHAGLTAVPGSNGSVVWGFFGTPFNETAPNDQVVTPFATGVGGTVSGKWDLTEGNGAGVNLTNQLPFIFAGQSYINFHTVQFAGGEIRGQIFATPEPSSLVLLGLGSLGVIGLGLQRARIRRD